MRAEPSSPAQDPRLPLQRHDVEEKSVSVTGIVQRQDLWMLQARGRRDLGQESLSAEDRAEFGMKELADAPGERIRSGALPGESVPWAPSTGRCSLPLSARASRPPLQPRTDAQECRPAGS